MYGFIFERHSFFLLTAFFLPAKFFGDLERQGNAFDASRQVVSYILSPCLVTFLYLSIV